MNDLGERLRRASELVTAPDEPFERLAGRRDRRRRRERLTAVAVSVALVFGVVGGALFALSRTGGHGGHTASTSAGSALALADGQYLYLEELVTTGYGDVRIQTWWANDGSGHVEASCSTSDCRWG